MPLLLDNEYLVFKKLEVLSSSNFTYNPVVIKSFDKELNTDNLSYLFMN